MVDANTTAMIDNVSACATGIVSLITTIMGMFLQPPIVYFLALGVVGTVAGIVKRMIKAKH